jgi:hypothetical protein
LRVAGPGAVGQTVLGEAGMRDVAIRAQRLSAAFGARHGPANGNSHSHDQQPELPIT